MIRIALDAMGNDHAPDVPVEGAILALPELASSSEILLVGRAKDLDICLANRDVADGRIRIVDAPEIIDMSEKPLAAIRGKRKSSIRVGLELQKAGEADAFISGGNTGAVLAGSTLLLGLHPGVERATVPALFPTRKQSMLVLDCGANIDCTARELKGFAHLGSVYSRDVLGRADPTVGLLNIGEEEEKGHGAVREAHSLLRQDAGINFIGNVEGGDILNGMCDVLVCDGFVGNVLLKFYETAARLFRELLQREVDPEVLEKPGIQRLAKLLDYTETGGAPLLGIKGVAIICHGSSPARAIKNAIGVALQSVETHVSQHIGAEFADNGAAA